MGGSLVSLQGTDAYFAFIHSQDACLGKGPVLSQLWPNAATITCSDPRLLCLHLKLLLKAKFPLSSSLFHSEGKNPDIPSQDSSLASVRDPATGDSRQASLYQIAP